MFVIAQLNSTVGKITANVAKIVAALQHPKHLNHLVIFPEMAISGYCPQDLLLRKDFIADCYLGLQSIQQQAPEASFILSLPLNNQGRITNSLVYVNQGKVVYQYAKRNLPNYAVFDEKRYFSKGSRSGIINYQNCAIGLLVCEDIWNSEHIYQLAKHSNLQYIISINASPYHQGKQSKRIKWIKQVSNITKTPVCYTNLVGGQDELVFDGGSLWVNAETDDTLQLPQFCEATACVNLQDSQLKITSIDYLNQIHHRLSQAPSDLTQIYSALMLGLADYVKKSGFQQVILGLSGGIDSAFCLALAIDALGAKNVTAVLLPSQYTSDESNRLAKSQAENLNANYFSIPIQQAVNEINIGIQIPLKQLPDEQSITRQNIQSRIRGNTLMALSNELGCLLLATGNKSEYATGYATLYGDMSGTFAPIKDVYKTLVYRLSRWRNEFAQRTIILPEVIQREPTAELAPNQKDRDSLPNYIELDTIIKLFIEKQMSIQQIVDNGHSKSTVQQVIKLIHTNEFKRRQAAPGTRITEKSFGRDYRMPINQGYF